MKAIALPRHGGADDLELTEQPTPAVAPGEFLVRVKAAGVNPGDEKIAIGTLDGIMVTHFPLIPGFEMSGVVEARGFGATEFEIGDEVIGFVVKDWAQNGTYAELVSAPARTLARKPASWDWLHSACLPLNGLTAYQAIKRINIGESDTVLIHGAAGGVGTLAVQIAATRGAHVIGTASERNHDYLRELGATPITYGEGLAERVRELAPEGVDAALDFYGGGRGGRLAEGLEGSRAGRLRGRHHRSRTGWPIGVGTRERRRTDGGGCARRVREVGRPREALLPAGAGRRRLADAPRGQPRPRPDRTGRRRHLRWPSGTYTLRCKRRVGTHEACR
ncbi:hypothetical protein GCM10017744_013190 [Streptomyces antimycoticus]